MNHNLNLGKKLLYFRKRASLSQFDLEMAIEASPGSISRIESGQTNPTKETLSKIDEVLKLTNLEREYFHGKNAEPATEEEIEAAREEVKELFETTGVIAYVVDDRSRIISVSKSLTKIVKFEKTMLEKVLGKTLLEVIIDPKYNVNKFIKNKHYEGLIKNLLELFYIEKYFMFDDLYINDVLDLLRSNPLENKIWEEIVTRKPKSVNTFEKRTVYLSLLGFTIPLIYNTENLRLNPRFWLVEYTPYGKIHKLISKLL